MLVIDHVLLTVSNTKTLGILMAESPAIAELVQDYNTLINDSPKPNNGEERMIAKGDMFGSDLKLYIAMMTAYEQMKLMNRYLSNLAAAPTPAKKKVVPVAEETDDADAESTIDHSDVKEDRQLRRFMIKTLFITVMVLLFIVIGAVIAIMVHNHSVPDNVLIKTIMQTAAEIIKILFSTNTK